MTHTKAPMSAEDLYAHLTSYHHNYGDKIDLINQYTAQIHDQAIEQCAELVRSMGYEFLPANINLLKTPKHDGAFDDA